MSAIDQELLGLLYLGEVRSYSSELVELARLCCKRHDERVDGNFTEGRAIIVEIDTHYEEAVRLGFEGSRVIWRRYVVGTREKEL
jgi:hypothetical protein